MTNCCDEISYPTPIHVASRITRIMIRSKAGSFVESDLIETSWAGKKLLIWSCYQQWLDRFWNRIGSFLDGLLESQLFPGYTDKSVETLYISRSFWARFQKRSDHCEKVIGSLISRQLMIYLSDRIPRTILLRSDHDPQRSCSLRGSVLDQKFQHNNWSFYR